MDISGLALRVESQQEALKKFAKAKEDLEGEKSKLKKALKQVEKEHRDQRFRLTKGRTTIAEYISDYRWNFGATRVHFRAGQTFDFVGIRSLDLGKSWEEGGNVIIFPKKPFPPGSYALIGRHVKNGVRAHHSVAFLLDWKLLESIDFAQEDLQASA